MPNRATRCISTKKEPKQVRSEQLVQAILQAAIQVLQQEGATRFTTARVAERAGVSVGSLYQYFPNKAAILFRLQLDEWRNSALTLGTILRGAEPPSVRLRLLVHAFLSSECAEADVRRALADAAPFYRDETEAKAAREEADEVFDAFLSELLPDLPKSKQELASELIIATLTSVGKSFSYSPRTSDDIERYAMEMADMLCGYVKELR